MCEKIRRPGSGCTNIGATGLPIPIGLTPPTQTFIDRSKIYFKARSCRCLGGIETLLAYTAPTRLSPASRWQAAPWLQHRTFTSGSRQFAAWVCLLQAVRSPSGFAPPALQDAQ